VRFEHKPATDLQRSVKQLLIEKIPLVALSIIAAAATMIAQSSSGAVGSMEKYPITARLANAAVSYMRYLRKMIAPTDLAIFYPNHQDANAWMIALSLAALAAITYFALRSRTKRPWMTVGWLWFAGAMIPMIGLVQSGAQSMADRFTYLPMIGLAIAVAWAVPQLIVESWRRRAVACVFAMTLLLTLSRATRQQISYWHDSQSVFEHALAVTNDNHVAHNNLAFELARQQKFADAREHYLAALKIHPTYSVAHNGLGTVYARTGNRAAAMREYELAVHYNPSYAVAHRNLGVQLASIGKVNEAIEQYRAAIELRPDDATARSLLGMTFATQGRLNEAAEQFAAAVDADPSDAQAKLNLGHALVELHRPREALVALHGALRLDPKLTEAHYHAGAALAQLHDSSAAAKEFGAVLKVQPNDRSAQLALQQVLGFPQQRTASVAD
jgi:tetratricopeptide (TPR) repeat protein